MIIMQSKNTKPPSLVGYFPLSHSVEHNKMRFISSYFKIFCREDDYKTHVPGGKWWDLRGRYSIDNSNF